MFSAMMTELTCRSPIRGFHHYRGGEIRPGTVGCQVDIWSSSLRLGIVVPESS
jgi:hypothetical protein